MMGLWIVDGIVQYVGFIKNGRKSWLIVTNDELQNGKFSRPTKLPKRRGSQWNSEYWKWNSDYWKGLAMPTQFYLKTMALSDHSHSLSAFVELALEHSLQKLKKNRAS
ncbi:MAG: hypothetical protein F6J89_03320 [Symploca sp. SIO1C4]|uniref:Uncharacterized protein n=1 Tax=Symploca sp. SIO1C4 TaxID=2607765 RepID=A0A6B3N550_9CYAN|nr:hypothetical protein [Symploca sp. SIO1C4]